MRHQRCINDATMSAAAMVAAEASTKQENNKSKQIGRENNKQDNASNASSDDQSHSSTTSVVGIAVSSKPMRMTIRKAHDLLGHMNEETTQKAAVGLGWAITKGALGVCKACAVAKSKKKTYRGTPKLHQAQKTREGCLSTSVLYGNQST
jgi:hypothetical protein